MDLSVITVTWNSEELITEQISSVFLGCKNIKCEEIVSDSGSSDRTVEFIKNQFPQVTVIDNQKNIGFGKGNNQGFEIAKGEFLLFLNPDMRVEPGSLDKILDWMKKNPKVAIACPKLIDQNGKLNLEATPRRFPRLWEQLALILKIPHFFPKILDKYHMRDFNTDLEQEVDSVRGSFMLMRRDFVEKLGWAFDPRYFIWYEDVDICREAYRLGYKVMYTPVISCVDYVGQSFKKRQTLWKQKNFTRSMLTYFQKWEPWYKWILIMLLRPVGITMAWVNDLLHAHKNKK